MHYYTFHIADYRKDTVHLVPIEHYIYRTLLDNYYLDERPIPLETQSVMRRLCLDFSLEKNLLNVLQDFFTKTEKGWINPRADREIKKYHSQCEKNKVNGIKGGRPLKTQSVPSGLPDETQTKPKKTLTNNHKPITNNQDKESSASELPVIYSQAFLAFWELYPNKKNKGDGFKAFKKIKPPEYPEVKAGLERAKKSPDWLKDNGKFIPHPASWLNARGWEDELPEVKQSNQWEDKL